jgi:hypothetical protein
MAETTIPSPAEAIRWIGANVTDLDGDVAGQVHGFFIDAVSGDPAWLIVHVGRRRSARLIAVPMRDCAGAAFGVWVAQEGDLLHSAPVVDPDRPLRREHELTICAHYGAAEATGRAAEVASRAAGSVTAMPPK